MQMKTQEAFNSLSQENYWVSISTYSVVHPGSGKATLCEKGDDGLAIEITVEADRGTPHEIPQKPSDRFCT